jgi:hypothetical protein
MLFVYILGGEAALQVCAGSLLLSYPGLQQFAVAMPSLASRTWCSDVEHCAQALIVQFGGDAFGTRPLTLQQWAACIGFGALGLLVRRGLLYLQPKTEGHGDK